ncbi:MAG: CBS domain-containing protein [Myxococcales bacterium]|nr:CBS domain-containing protein [Myxococcales bacterium]
MSNFTMPVASYMSAPVHTITPDTPLRAVQELLEAHRISSLPVVDGDGRPLGVISRTDLIRVGRLQTGTRPSSPLLVLPERPVSVDMTKGITTVPQGESIRDAAAKLIAERVHRVFVTEGETLVGVLSTKDIMQAIAEQKVRRPIQDFMSAPLFSIRAEEPVALATERLERAGVSGVVVVDDGWPVGMFTQAESLLASELARDTPVEEVMGHSLVCMNIDTLVHRAAAQAAATRCRRVIAVEARQMRGILTGIDFARATQS